MHEEYAEALRKTIEDGTAPKVAVKALHNALSVRGRSALLPRIARSFTRIISRIESRDNIVLKVARESYAKRALKEASHLLKELKLKSDEVRILVDSNIIGGWRLEGREILRDASHRKQLLDIYERVSGK